MELQRWHLRLFQGLNGLGCTSYIALAQDDCKQLQDQREEAATKVVQSERILGLQQTLGRWIIEQTVQESNR
jgi:hypothetical protein